MYRKCPPCITFFIRLLKCVSFFRSTHSSLICPLAHPCRKGLAISFTLFCPSFFLWPSSICRRPFSDNSYVSEFLLRPYSSLWSNPICFLNSWRTGKALSLVAVCSTVFIHMRNFRRGFKSPWEFRFNLCANNSFRSRSLWFCAILLRESRSNISVFCLSIRLRKGPQPLKPSSVSLGMYNNFLLCLKPHLWRLSIAFRWKPQLNESAVYLHKGWSLSLYLLFKSQLSLTIVKAS